MSAALSLARDYGIKATVLEARSVAWGCSGRNGSFARIFRGRMPITRLIKVYGQEAGNAYFNEMRQALNAVRALIRDGAECDAKRSAGVWMVAHWFVLPGLSPNILFRRLTEQDCLPSTASICANVIDHVRRVEYLCIRMVMLILPLNLDVRWAASANVGRWLHLQDLNLVGICVAVAASS